MTGSVHEKLPGVVAFPGHANVKGRNAVPLATACPVIGTRRAEIATARAIPGTKRRNPRDGALHQKGHRFVPGGRRLVPWEPELGDQATAVARRAGATRPTRMKPLTGKLCKG